MNQRHLAAEAGQEVGFFHGRIAAAHHHDFLAAEEKAVAGGAGAHAVANQFLLVFQPEPARRSAGRDNQRARLHNAAVVQFQRERPLRQIGSHHAAMFKRRAETLRLLLHVLHQLRAR